MQDAATRFYKRSHERAAEHGEPTTAIDRHHRYFVTAAGLQQTKPERVLELGYGGTRTVCAMASLISGEYHIIDIVDRTNNTTLPNNVRMHIANLDNDFPLEDRSFDCVVALMVLEHLYDPFHSFAEIARVMRRGGIAYVNLPNVASIRCRMDLLIGRMPMTSSRDWFDKREWDGNHLHYFVMADVKRLAALYGLRLVEIHPVGKMLWLKKLLPSLLCHEITYVFENSTSS